MPLITCPQADVRRNGDQGQGDDVFQKQVLVFVIFHVFNHPNKLKYEERMVLIRTSMSAPALSKAHREQCDSDWHRLGYQHKLVALRVWTWRKQGLTSICFHDFNTISL